MSRSNLPRQPPSCCSCSASSSHAGHILHALRQGAVALTASTIKIPVPETSSLRLASADHVTHCVEGSYRSLQLYAVRPSALPNAGTPAGALSLGRRENLVIGSPSWCSTDSDEQGNGEISKARPAGPAAMAQPSDIPHETSREPRHRSLPALLVRPSDLKRGDRPTDVALRRTPCGLGAERSRATSVEEY